MQKAMSTRLESKVIIWLTSLLISFLYLECRGSSVKTVADRFFSTTVIIPTDSIILQSSDTYCRGGNPILTVTGINVKWYADASKKTLLHQGNTYQSPPLDKTTTFYLTQTINLSESGVQAITIEMVEALLVNVLITPASCGKSDGTISITATGATARNPVYYQLDYGPYQSSPIFTNLAVGPHTIIDKIGECIGSKNVIVPSPPIPKISTIDSLAPHCGNMDGALTITAFGGIGSLLYSLNGVDFKADNRFTNLEGGTYTVTVKDSNQCTVSQQITLKRTVKLQLNKVNEFPSTCGLKNGRITVDIGASNGNVTYSITGHPEQSSSTFDSLSAGTYSILVSDQTGCHDTTTVQVASSQELKIIHIGMYESSCSGATGQLTITANRMTGLLFSVDGQHFQRDSIFSQLVAGTYIVIVKDDQKCQVEQTVKLGFACLDAVYLPDAFTPNQDNVNDGWAIFFPTPNLGLESLTILNRWGEIVLQSGPRVVTNGDILWNGFYKGETKPGLYSYQLEIKLATGKTHFIHGTLLLIQ